MGYVRERLGVSFPPASELVQRMVDADMLVEVTGREQYWVYQRAPYVRLFSDPERRAGRA